MHMRRTSILLDPGVIAELERFAHRDGRPTSHVIREALDDYVGRRQEEERALPGFIGLGRGPGDDRDAAAHPEAQLPADGSAESAT